MSVDADVSEAFRAVSRFECGAVACRGDHIGLEGNRWLARGFASSKIRLRHISGLIKDLTVNDRHRRSGRTEVVQSDPSIAVLSEVDDMTSGRDLTYRHCWQLF